MKLKNNILFEDRKVVFVRIENFSQLSAKGYSIENLVLISKAGNTDSYFDIGSLCYKIRLKTDKVTHFAKVNKSSFNENIAKALKKYLSYKYLTLTISASRTIFGDLKTTIVDLYSISEKGIDLRFDDLNQCHIIYEQYSKQLVSRIKSKFKDPNFFSTRIYATRQQVCADLIAANCDVDIKAFKSNYIEIKSYTSQNQEKTVFGDDEYSAFISQSKEIFYKFSEFTFNKNDLPIILDIKGAEKESKKYIYVVANPKREPSKYYLSDERRLLSRIETVENIKYLNKVSELNVRFKKSEEDLPYRINKSYNGYLNRILKANSLDSKERIKVINLAISAFAMWLLLDSGCNLSVVFNMKVKDLDAMIADTANGFVA